MPDFDPALQMAYDALTDPQARAGDQAHHRHQRRRPAADRPALLAKMKARQDHRHDGRRGHARRRRRTRRWQPIATRDRRPAIYNVDQPQAAAGHLHQGSRGWSASRSSTRRRSCRMRRVPQRPDGEAAGRAAAAVRLRPHHAEAVAAGRNADRDAAVRATRSFPLLAYWHYGLGKAVAFTSDAGAAGRTRRPGTATGPARGMYAKFWEQVVDWSLRPTESRQAEHDHRVPRRQDPGHRRRPRRRQSKPDHRPEAARRHHVADAGKADEPSKRELRVRAEEQRPYEAEVKAEEAGSYFVNAQAVRPARSRARTARSTRSRRRRQRPRRRDAAVLAGVRRAGEQHAAAGKAARRSPAARRYEDDDEALAEGGASRRRCSGRPAASRRSLQPIWYWLLFAGGGAAVLRRGGAAHRGRRRQVAAATWRGIWARLRGRPAAAGPAGVLGALAEPQGAGRRGAGPRPGGAALRGGEAPDGRRPRRRRRAPAAPPTPRPRRRRRRPAAPDRRRAAITPAGCCRRRRRRWKSETRTRTR